MRDLRVGAVIAAFMFAAACGGGTGPRYQTGAAGTTGTGASSGASGSAGGGLAGSGGPAGGSGAGASGSSGEGGNGGPSGSAGTTGTSGTSGAGGAAGTAATDAGAAGAAGADASPAKKDFACTELIGLWVASQWWPAFEKGVDTTKWEFMFQHHGYLEMFADPASPYWNNAVSSKCATNAAAPDRVVFLPFSLSLSTMDAWVTNLTKVVETMKGKFPGVQRIELMTTLRSPGNMPCANDNDPNTVVPPYVDAAIQQVADASGGLVTVGPKIELTSCSWWAGGTDLTGAGNTGAGELLAAYYQTH